MMTLKDAIAVGSAICKVASRITSETAGRPQDQSLRHMGRGTCIYALDDLWYDVLPLKVRDQLGNSKERFYTECGWPA
jgi:hypothetical protein